MHLINSPSETNDIDKKVKNTLGTYFIPAFTGLGAPHWKSDVKGAIVGLTRATTTDHIIRACLESMAYSTQDILKEMQGIKELRCDGGVANNNFMLSFQADLSRIKVTKQANVEATVLGTIYLAGLASGAFKNLEEISALIKPTKLFLPKRRQEEMQILYNGWQKAVKRL